jgi:ferric-dicitrate binding protein FerR (iron transport regulator)
MTPNNDNISKTLERSFPSASREQVESARDRIYGRLHSNSDEKPAAENFRLVPVSRWRWTVAAAAAVTFMVGIAIWMGNGERVIVLADGSRVEQLRDSELSMQEATDGIRIHLNRGGVIVTASKQHAGRHLVVQTKDVTVSVAGTTFSVNAEEGGSRVAVYEGEVRIQQGSIEKKLGAGERWRSEPSTQMASLQQPAAAPPPPRETFEEVSIRLASGPVQAGVRGGAVNVNIQGCSGGSAVESILDE